MIQPSNTDGRIDVPELWLILQDLEEGKLGEAHSDELAELLAKSPAARRAYLGYFQQSAVLRLEAAKLHERGLLPFVGAANQTRRILHRSVMAAAALVAIFVIIAALIAVASPQPARFSVATTADTRWSVDGVTQKPEGKSDLTKEGSTLRVLSGTLMLQTKAGDQLVLQGPATASFPTLHRPHLHEGWLWIDTAKSGEPFEVTSGRFRIRDIGTRFGVRAPSGGATEVHLVEGQIKVIAAMTGKQVSDLSKAGQANAFTAKGEVEMITMAPDPFPTLPDLLLLPANYRTTVLGQAPISYWTLDEVAELKLSNAILGSPPASRGQKVRGGEPGPGPDSGFRGLPGGNQSLYMQGDPKRSVLFGLDGLNGVRQSEGAVSFWIQHNSGAIAKDEILWLAGYGSENSRIPFEAMLHTRIDRAGRIIFEMKNGNSSVNLSSPRSLNDGHWHHVAASWNPTSIDLFIDGMHVGHDPQPRTIKEGNLRGRFVRFGKPSLDQQEIFNVFTGWVDEISLWDRPLSAVEVRCQFDAAVGAAKE